MIVRDIQDVPAVVEHGVEGVTARWPIREEDGAPHFAMRVFDVAQGVSTPLHEHWWEHEVYVLAGQGYVEGPEARHELRPGTVVFVPGGEQHHFVNAGAEPLRFICLIPHRWLEGVKREA
ncbi:MAG: cupin domain-containing protein [Chloroflexi bacterium]|nr:cupin domain-containing protein [Chloroflexota bacterium]